MVKLSLKLLFLLVILVSPSSFLLTTASLYNQDQQSTTSIIIGPYAQNSDGGSIVISWETSEKTRKNTVHWGSTPALGNITNEKNILKRNLHQVRVEDLNPSTKYYYKVVSDTIESKLYTFHTSFEPDNTVKFVVYGDSRGVWDNWENANIVAQVIEEQQPYFVLHTGDLVKNGINWSQWIDFFSISKFIHNSTLYPCVGNHEYHALPYFQYFSLPGNEWWYSFDNGPVHFIALDSSVGIGLKVVQLFWMINDLRSNDQPFTVVFFHHPLYSSGDHGSTLHLRWLWKPVFEYFDVDIVFNGHDHCYERAQVNNITYVVTGGGGAPLYDVGCSWWTVHAEKTYHYCLVTANQSVLTFEAIKPDGTLFDAFSIEK